jgi:prefoldin subunit 5
MEEELNRLRKSKKELKDTIDKMQRKLEWVVKKLALYFSRLNAIVVQVLHLWHDHMVNDDWLYDDDDD